MALDPPPPPPDDGDEDKPLVERFLAGDKSAFQALARKYSEPLHSLVRRYVKNDHDAQDVSQRALLRAFEKLGTSGGGSSSRTWLSRIAIHLSLNHARGQGRVESIDLDDIASFTNALETAKLVAAELWQKVSARLDELPPKQRLVV